MSCLLEMLQRWQIPGELRATRPDNNLFVCVHVYTVALTVSVKQRQQRRLSGSPDSTNRHLSLETLQPADQTALFGSVSRRIQSDLSDANCCVSQCCRLLLHGCRWMLEIVQVGACQDGHARLRTLSLKVLVDASDLLPRMLLPMLNPSQGVFTLRLLTVIVCCQLDLMRDMHTDTHTHPDALLC